LNTSRDILLQAIKAQSDGQMDEAERLFREVLLQEPGDPGACYSLGVIALRRNDIDAARTWAKIGLEAAPGFAPLHFLAGTALRAAGAAVELVLQFFDHAVALQPEYVEALINSGVVLRDALRHREALARFNRVLEINPDYPTALVNAGILLTEFKQSERAIALFERLLQVQPDFDYGQGLLLLERLHVCDWRGYDAAVADILAANSAGKRCCKSLAMMAISDSAADHQRAAKTFAEHLYPASSHQLAINQRYQHKKIRVAYVSPDLREHPVGHLLTGVIEAHDKSRFELIAISLGIDDQSRIRQRMLGAFDKFVDAKLLNSVQIARAMRDLEIDIAVDLGGYTADCRPDVFAQRPAPIQVSFLGYAGTMAVDYMDYMIADRHVVPRDHWPNYSEKLVYLPDAYMPVDSSLIIGPSLGRKHYGLPEDGLVFCAFCHDYKISPVVYAIWMRLLARHPGSVLWLMSRSEVSQRNLRQAATQDGVDPNRLVFATRVPRVEDHLARYRLADLFLDTYPYNAHTTAADALMAGLPVLTCMGDAFHSRVAGSLSYAAGLPDLVTSSLTQYEEFANRLADHPNELVLAREKLAVMRHTAPLFDTEKYCRYLEEAYIAMVRKDRLGAEVDAL
jgi:predicted O-linked N-acetylglucosamine transferase (SPINDLY family)